MPGNGLAAPFLVYSFQIFQKEGADGMAKQLSEKQLLNLDSKTLVALIMSQHQAMEDLTQ